MTVRLSSAGQLIRVVIVLSPLTALGPPPSAWCAPNRSPAHPFPVDWTVALDAIGWTAADLAFDEEDVALFVGDPHGRLPLHGAWFRDPAVIAGDALAFERSLAAAAPSQALSFAATRRGGGVRRGLIGDPAAALRDSLHGGDPLGAGLARISPGISTHPFDGLDASWRQPMGLLLSGAVEAARARDEALASADDLLALESLAFRYVAAGEEAAPPAREQREFEAAAARFDLPLFQAGAMDLVLAIEAVLPRLEALADSGRAEGLGRPVSIETRLGAVVFGTAGRDSYPPGEYLLIVDPGGDDLYEGGASASPARPVSILLDLGGDDRYVSADTLHASFGAGVLGAGILVDLRGDDRYAGRHVTQGAGVTGIGMLWDLEGNDVYDADTASQGAGFFGYGLLIDDGGADRYHLFQQGQAYGYAGGAGLLIDRAGDDLYEADDTQIRYPSSQAPDHNASLAQGFGFGKRADFSDGHSLPGGFGMLLDLAGSDRYRAGVFGQGAGYWLGVGLLIDAEGNDDYAGVWYTEGAAAHFAIGVLVDDAGDDHFSATHNMALGAGHDFSLGLLVDRAGDDLFRAPNLSLGGGNADGIGIFWDCAGDDRYQVEAATTLGRSNIGSRGGLRERMKNLGLFVDSAGKDQYPESKPFAHDGALWTQHGENLEAPLPVELGVGLDAEPGEAGR